MNTTPEGLHGYCSFCSKEHHLPAGNSKKYCRELMQHLEHRRRLDYLSSTPVNSSYSTSNLFGKARGKMFGVLEGVDENGITIVVYGFSGQYNGCWTVPGWAPPLFDEDLWQSTNFDTEKTIKEMSRRLETTPMDTSEYAILKQKRKRMSQNLMVEIHSLYRLRNFRGQVSTLDRFFPDNRGIPTGAGDCCGPKLLNYAQLNNIIPLSISEFYWGKENKSGTRRHGHFYPACLDKCRPLMGFMLCGLEEKRQKL
jgi:hypothetical protein